MAFIRKQRKGKTDYYSVVENRRRGEKVTQKVLEYIGKDPSLERLAAAAKYWKVGTKARRKGAKR